MLRKHAQNAWANCSEIGDHSAQIVLTKHNTEPRDSRRRFPEAVRGSGVSGVVLV